MISYMLGKGADMETKSIKIHFAKPTNKTKALDMEEIKTIFDEIKDENREYFDSIIKVLANIPRDNYKIDCTTY